MKFQRIAIVSLVIAASGLAGCSSTSKSTAGSTASTVDVSGSTPAPPVTSPADTTAPATAPPATPAPTNPPPASHNLYDLVDQPNVPGGHTDAFASSGVLANGLYWVQYNGGETFTPDITVVQAFFGDECEAQAVSAGDECLNGIFILDPPSRDIADLPFADNVFLTIASSTNQLSYWITPDELRTIRSGSPTVDNAPDGVFSSFAFLMTVETGAIVQFEQVWTP